MKKCSYCGKEYGDEAAFCSIDGQPLGIEQLPSKYKRPLPRSVAVVWILALIIVAQALIRLAFNPYDPSRGEGNYETVEAAFYLWLCLGVGIVLFCYGLYLMVRKKNGPMA